MKSLQYLSQSLFIAIGIFLLSNFSLQAQPTFQKHYDYNNYNLVSAKHLQTRDSGFVIFHPELNDTIYIFKTDKDGRQIWSRKIPAIQDSLKINIKCVTELNDGSLVFGGSIDPGIKQSYRDFFLMKFTKDGVLVWSKFYTKWGMDDEISAITSENNMIFAAGKGNSYRALPSDYCILQIDMNGNFIKGNSYWLEQVEITGIAKKNGWVYVSFNVLQPNQQNISFIQATDIYSNAEYIYGFNIKGGNTARAIIKAGDNLYMSGEIKDGNKTSLFYVKLMDLPYNPKAEVFEIQHPFRIFNNNIGADADGNIYLAGGVDTSSFLVSSAIITKIDTTDKISWSKIYYGSGNNQFFNSVSIAKNGNISACGVTLIDHIRQNDIYLTAADKNGRIFCKETDIKLDIVKLDSSMKTLLVSSYKDIYMPGQDIYLKTLNHNFEESTFCFPRLPEAGFTVSDSVFCVGQCISVTDASKYAEAWNWEFENRNAGSSVSQEPEDICFNKPGKYKITQIVRNAKGTDTAIKFITVRDCSLSFYIPNAFTPNYDKLNNFFEVVGENIEEIHKRVYNRWKQRIFDEKGKNPRWDGWFNGEKVQVGVYLYIIEIKGIDGRKEMRKGTFHLMY